MALYPSASSRTCRRAGLLTRWRNGVVWLACWVPRMFTRQGHVQQIVLEAQIAGQVRVVLAQEQRVRQRKEHVIRGLLCRTEGLAPATCGGATPVGDRVRRRHCALTSQPRRRASRQTGRGPYGRGKSGGDWVVTARIDPSAPMSPNEKPITEPQVTVVSGSMVTTGASWGVAWRSAG